MYTAIRVIPLLMLTIGMFYYPQEVLSSASDGLSLWWRFVLPALLPFFILSELLMAEGFVHFLGVMLEPLMRPLFRLPGNASFVLAMAHTAGIPIGAMLTSKLRQQGELTRVEGERLLAFSSNPSPGFMFGAIASGLLGKASLGIVLAGSIYIANIIVGLIFRFYRAKGASTPNPQSSSFKKAVTEMQRAQKDDGRPLGQLLGDAVRQSVTTILMVGGFITFFSVIIHMLNVWKITSILAALFHPVLGLFMPLTGIEAFIEGLIETTIGCKSTIQAFPYLNQQVGMLTFLMGWGGLSVFAQVASFTSTTDLRFSAFILGRTLHAFLALAISQIFLSFTEIPATNLPIQPLTTSELWWNTWRLSSIYFIIIISVLIGISILHRIWRQARN